MVAHDFSSQARSYKGVLLGAAAALGAAALWNYAGARKAERRHPPRGRFVEIDGVRLHYLERGRGRPVVLLHGNLTMAEEMAASGLFDRAAERYRVVAFDRPGYGYSDRTRDRVWTPAAQADLLHEAFRRLGLERPIVVGHSFGTIVAFELALRHPEAVSALVLLSGYYFPTVRAEVPLLAPPAIPVVGDVMRYTVSPLLGRLAWPGILRLLFGPAPATPGFEALEGMMLRPSQIRASASESAALVPAVAGLQHHYRELRVPVVIAAGADDHFVGTEDQSVRLHRLLPQSELRVVPGAGHMVHHTAPEAVLAAIDLAAERVGAAARLRMAAE
ncbi:alpha/beta fold hydrolase [Benzoatithermus flavus]|uniref:Alpha/beta hydrolase n=1 Tax=Benzoatithermus flavus TaxID=3108223 RepID=A0ABU8XSG4_9PROT